MSVVRIYFTKKSLLFVDEVRELIRFLRSHLTMQSCSDDGFKQQLLRGVVKCGLPTCTKAGTDACSQCRSIGYCSKTCQTAHWQTHKPHCRQGTRHDRKTESIDAYRGLQQIHQNAQKIALQPGSLENAFQRIVTLQNSTNRAKALDVSTARGSRVQQARQDCNAATEQIWLSQSDGQRRLALEVSSLQPGPEHEAMVALHQTYQEKHGPSTHADPEELAAVRSVLLPLLDTI